MEVNHNELSNDDQQVIGVWDAFFQSAGWNLFMQRFSLRLEGTVTALENASDMKALGRARGVRDTLLEVTDLEAVVEHEFNAKIAAAQAERLEIEESRGAMA